MKGYIRHALVQKLIKYPAKLFYCLKFNIHYSRTPKLKGPCLILCNHNTDIDPILAGFAFPAPIYHVASEHVFRHGFISKILRYFFDPISKMKGSSDSASVREVLRRLREGKRVMIFAEGNRSFDGRTCPIPDATGKLARLSGVPLVTFRMEGGYLTSPRWSNTMRRGWMRCGVVNIYSPEQLKSMTTAQVNAAIAADLAENAYDRQNEVHKQYKGKRLAEGIERALFFCPQCGSIDSMHSEGDYFSCSCGLRARYLPTGKLQGTIPFTTIPQWEDWQKNELQKRITASTSNMIFSDENAVLSEITPDHETKTIATGSLTLSKDSLQCAGTSFPLSQISDMAVFAHCNIAFTAAGNHYELRSPSWKCGRKYYLAWQILKELN